MSAPLDGGSADHSARWAVHIERADDANTFGHGLDEPLGPLLRAAHSTALRRFYPFTSMNRLCFAESPFPLEGLQSAFVAFVPEGHYPGGRYFVHNSLPFESSRRRHLLATSDPAEAVEAVLGLLSLLEGQANLASATGLLEDHVLSADVGRAPVWACPAEGPF